MYLLGESYGLLFCRRPERVLLGLKNYLYMPFLRVRVSAVFTFPA